MLANLTETQARCTELLNEVRALRAKTADGAAPSALNIPSPNKSDRLADRTAPLDIKFRLDAKLSELAPWRRVDATLARDTVDHVLDGVKPIPELVRIFGKHEAQEEHVRRHREALKDLFKRCLEQAVHEMAWELAKEMIPDDCR